MLALGAALSLVVGLLLGMLGGGGAILTLPMLVYVMGVASKDAIASSLLVVGATSLVGMMSHARAGVVQWRVGAMFGATAMAGAFAGGHIAKFIPGTILLVSFGVVMVVTATLMLSRNKQNPGAQAEVRGAGATTSRAANPPVILVLGALVGLLSGLVGAGGGFMVVPALALFGGLSMRQAIGTSLLVISMQSAAGFAGHFGHATLDFKLLGVVTGCAILGSLVGTAVGKHIPAEVLRRGFAWFVVAMGIFMFFKQLPLSIALVASATTLVAVGLASRRQISAPAT